MPAVEYQVVHAVPGRCRIRIPRLGGDPMYAQQLQYQIQQLKFVIEVRLNVAACSAIVSYQESLADLADFKAQLLATIQSADQLHLVLPAQEADQPVANLPWQRLGLSAIGLGLAVVTPVLEWPLLPVLTGGVIVAATLPVFAKAIAGLGEEGKPTGALQEAFWITINTLRGEFLEPALGSSLANVGESLRNSTCRASQLPTLDRFADNVTAQVWVEQQNSLECLPLKAVQPGNTIAVFAGDMIPVDGKIVRGTALIDQHNLTGESIPVVHAEHQQVYASTLVLEGHLYIRVEKVLDQTKAGQAIALSQTAPTHDTRIADYAGQVGDAFIWPILITSAGFAIAGDWQRASTVLMLDCATGTELSIPTAILVALKQAKDQQVYIRSGHDLELLAKVDTIVFDKTGTLTQPTNQVIGIETYTETTSESEILRLAVSVEQGHPHPVAKAIRDYARSQQITPQACTDWSYRGGMGVRAQVGEQTILVGSLHLLKHHAVDLEPLHDHCQRLRQSDRSHVYVAKNGQVLGAIIYQGALRPESAEVVAALQAHGIKVYLTTGDHPQAAHATATELGIPLSQVYPEQLPAQKAELVRRLQDQGQTVIYVGDGINDAPALADADVAVSFTDGSAFSREAAGVVLLDNHLGGLLRAVKIGQQTMALVAQNTAIVSLPNIGAVIAALFLGLEPALSVLISDGVIILAELNSLRGIPTGAATPNHPQGNSNQAGKDSGGSRRSIQ
jgi:P-type Cu2+ transporter